MDNLLKKKIIYIDFDGVLNTYSGWAGKEELFIPKQGLDSFLSELSNNYEISIFTTRNLLDIAEWLIKYDLKKYISNITNVKAPAFAYIDDRAITFKGSYSKTINDLKKFKTYWE